MLMSKEAEIAGIYKELIIAQMEYYRTALQKLENILPEIDRKIGNFVQIRKEMISMNSLPVNEIFVLI